NSLRFGRSGSVWRNSFKADLTAIHLHYLMGLLGRLWWRRRGFQSLRPAISRQRKEFLDQRLGYHILAALIVLLEFVQHLWIGQFHARLHGSIDPAPDFINQVDHGFAVLHRLAS